MSQKLPDRENWKEIVKYFTDRKADGEGLAIILSRSSIYRKTGKIETAGNSAKTVNKKNATAKKSKRRRAKTAKKF